LILEHGYLDLVEERIDLAIRHGQLSDSTDHQEAKCSRFGAVRFAGLSGGERYAAIAARSRNCLIYTYAASAAWTFTDPNGKAEVIRISGHLLANSGDALLAFALKDTG